MLRYLCNITEIIYLQWKSCLMAIVFEKTADQIFKFCLNRVTNTQITQLILTDRCPFVMTFLQFLFVYDNWADRCILLSCQNDFPIAFVKSVLLWLQRVLHKTPVCFSYQLKIEEVSYLQWTKKIEQQRKQLRVRLKIIIKMIAIMLPWIKGFTLWIILKNVKLQWSNFDRMYNCVV